MAQSARLIVLLAAVIAPVLAQPAAAADGPAWIAFSKLAATTPAYVETIVSHEVNGKATSDGTYRFTWMDPSNAKIEVLAGSGKGAVVIWTGGGKVQAYDVNNPAVVVPFDRMDKDATDLRGNPVGSAAFAFLRAVWASAGPLTETPGPVIDGAATTIVTMNPDPARMNGISKGELYVAASGAPKRVVLYEGTTLVEQDEFTNQNLSPKISARDFST